MRRKPDPGAAFRDIDRAIKEALPTDVPALIVALAARIVTLAPALVPPESPPVASGADENIGVTEAARRLGVSVDWLYRQKDIPFRRQVGRRVVFSAKGLDEWNTKQARGEIEGSR